MAIDISGVLYDLRKLRKRVQRYKGSGSKTEGWNKRCGGSGC